MGSMEEYHDAIDRRVAAACLDRKDDGTCNPPEGRKCVLELNLPEIVKAVKAVKSDRIDDYAHSIRETVCVDCINQDEHGECYFRDQMQCCLDNFMSLVVDAIDEVDSRYENASNVVS